MSTCYLNLWWIPSLKCVCTCYHNNLLVSEKFENAALFLRLGLPSTLILHQNGAFRKRSSNRRNLKTPAFRFRVDGKHFENGTFLKRWRLSTNLKRPLIVGFSNSLVVVLERDHNSKTTRKRLRQNFSNLCSFLILPVENDSSFLKVLPWQLSADVIC